MNISLSSSAEALIQRKIEAGHYQSPGEVMEEALRLLEQRDESRVRDLESLRREIAIGLEQARRGEMFDADEVFDELDAGMLKMANSSNA